MVGQAHPALHPTPKGWQVSEYIAKRGSHLSGTQMHMQGRGEGIQPLPSMLSPDEGPSEAQASTSQAEPIRDVWDLNSYQLQEILEALQIKMAQR